MSNAQIIKDAEKILLTLKSMPEFSSKNKNRIEYLRGFKLMIKEAIELKEQQEDLQSELLIVTLDLNCKIEEIIKRMETFKSLLNNDEKGQENIEELLGLD